MFKLSKQTHLASRSTDGKTSSAFSLYVWINFALTHNFEQTWRSLKCWPCGFDVQSGSDNSLSVFTCASLMWTYVHICSSASVSCPNIGVLYIALFRFYSYLIHPVADYAQSDKHMYALSRTHINHMPDVCHSAVMLCGGVWESCGCPSSIACSEIFSRSFRCHLRNMKRSRFAYLYCGTWLSLGIPYLSTVRQSVNHVISEF